jgi:hypothetical protein
MINLVRTEDKENGWKCMIFQFVALPSGPGVVYYFLVRGLIFQHFFFCRVRRRLNVT